MIEHVPVLLDQIIDLLKRHGALEKSSASKIVDCTLGLGGYSEKILETFPNVHLLGLDRDEVAIKVAQEHLREYKERFQALHTNFGDMERVLTGYAPFDAFVFDLGVSNMQITEPDRGFSFQDDGPLDMRMNPSSNDLSAADVLISLNAEALSRIFWEYGEERFSRKIALEIERRCRQGACPQTTGALVNMIREILPAPVQRKMGGHPARRIFQALRIYVNDELKELEMGLDAVKKMVAHEALVVVVSYHSLEDRIVKHTFRSWEKEEKKGFVVTKHPVVPEPEEIERNFKARSAKLRAFRFTKDKSGGKNYGRGQKKKYIE